VNDERGGTQCADHPPATAGRNDFMPDILLVEDKESLRRVLRLTLEHAGATQEKSCFAKAQFVVVGS